MCKISIIVPVYKVEKYINRCINSILNQKFKDFELILVDDGSPDNCGKICDDYATKDKRIRVIHKNNEGVSSARNSGLDIAKGEYIGFVDGYNYIHSNMYEILYNTIIDYESDISICDYEMVNNKNIEKYEVPKIINIKKFNNIEALNEMHKENGVKFVIACNKLYHKNIFKNIRYPYCKIHEDEFVIHKVLFNSKNTLYINYPLYYYYQNEEGITKGKFALKNFDASYAYKDRMKFFKEIRNINLYNKAQYTFVLNFFNCYKKAFNLLNMDNTHIKIYIKLFASELLYLLKCPLFNFKEKCMWVLFCINSNLYNKYLQLKGEIL